MAPRLPGTSVVYTRMAVSPARSHQRSRGQRSHVHARKIPKSRAP